ncbi:hypothetical protein COCNU_07G015100 [Cocos nucifera]|uniref:Uncharacterized protein n=1 Tax=Cocos nucifera TaxID=13894 RepID=A0A8K0N5I1_COCNU|nr:hypothetical protein COCNU_07G015100 [Cocos nucifera]
MEETVMKELKWIVMPPYSELFQEDLLKRLYSDGPALMELASVDPLRKKNKKKKKRKRIILSSSSKVAVVEDVTTKVEIAKPKASRSMVIKSEATKPEVAKVANKQSKRKHAAPLSKAVVVEAIPARDSLPIMAGGDALLSLTILPSFTNSFELIAEAYTKLLGEMVPLAKAMRLQLRSF